jgi:hypothetical protein
MRITLGQLVSELVDTYEQTYKDPELAAVAASVTLEELFEQHVVRRVASSSNKIRRGGVSTSSS